VLQVAIIVAGVSLFLSGMLSASETSTMLLSPGRIHRLVESGRKGAVELNKLAEHRHRLRAVSTLMGGLAFGSAVAAAILTGVAVGGVSLGALLVIISVLVVHTFAQALPRTVAATNPERIALGTARYALPTMRVVYPIAAVLGYPWKWAVDLVGGNRSITPWATTAEWRGVNTEEDAEREEAEEALLEAVSDFAEKIAREVMVPRTDMKALPDTATVNDAVAMISASGFSRIPIFHETVDDVRAVLYAKDLLCAMSERGGDRPVLELARPAYFVPETKPVEELMVEMRLKTHIAIVADEYGGTAGLVTLEDLLEEIVGEISDEYDREETLIVQLGGGRFAVGARLPIDDLNETFGTAIDIDADSVGGLFTEVAGRIPSAGESIEIEGLKITVTELEGTRIRQLLVEPAAPSEGDSNA
jgi:CBS domain containing-hemolysin-like protein